MVQHVLTFPSDWAMYIFVYYSSIIIPTVSSDLLHNTTPLISFGGRGSLVRDVISKSIVDKVDNFFDVLRKNEIDDLNNKNLN